MLRDASHCSTSPPSHKRIFTMSTQDLPQGTSTKNLINTNLEYTTPLSNTTTSTQEARHKAKTQSPLRKRDGHKAKLQSPLHKKDKTKSKQRKDYKLGDHNRPQTTLSDHNRPQIIFLTKTRSYR